jgi:hypothetical protein
MSLTRVVATLKGFVHSKAKQVSLDFGKLIGMPKLFVNSLLGAIAQVAWPAARPMAYGKQPRRWGSGACFGKRGKHEFYNFYKGEPMVHVIYIRFGADVFCICGQ